MGTQKNAVWKKNTKMTITLKEHEKTETQITQIIQTKTTEKKKKTVPHIQIFTQPST